MIQESIDSILGSIFYCSKIKTHIYLLFYSGHHTYGAVFQHDNATPHTANLTTQFLANNNVQILPRPFMSPDLNPVEHVRDELDRRVQGRANAPANVR